MKRRTVLAGIGVAATGGCLKRDVYGVLKPGVILNGIYITNYVPEEKVVEVVLEDSEETYVEREVVAEAGEWGKENGVKVLRGGATLECDWPADQRHFSAKARLEGSSEWVAIEPSYKYEEKCEFFRFVVEDWGLDATTSPCRSRGYKCGYNE